MNNRARQIRKVEFGRILKEHKLNMEELFSFMDEVFAEIYNEMEEEANEV